MRSKAKTIVVFSVFIFVSASFAAANPVTDFIERSSGEEPSDSVVERYFEEGIDGDAIEKQEGDFSQSFTLEDMLSGEFALSFVQDDALEPGDAATYDTSIRYSPDGSYCSFHGDDYPQRYAIWLEGEGTGTENTAYENNGFDAQIYCDGTYTDVNIDVEAPETVGDYEYGLYIAPNPFVTAYPLFDEKNPAGSDTLTVEDPVDEPTARLSLSTHQATEGDTVKVDASSTSGDYTQVNLEVWRNGDFLEGITDLQDQGYSTDYTVHQRGDYTFELDVRYTDDDFFSDEDEATLTVEEDVEPVDADMESLPGEVDEGETVTFDGSSSTGEGTVERYSWYVEGNFVGEGQTESYTFTEPGTKTVAVEVEDSAGQTDTAQTSVSVEAVEDVTVWVPVSGGDSCEEVDSESVSSSVESFGSEQQCLDSLENGDDDDNGNGDDGTGVLNEIFNSIVNIVEGVF